MAEALPAIRKMAQAKLSDDPKMPSNRVAVGRALALLKDPDGIARGSTGHAALQREEVGGA